MRVKVRIFQIIEADEFILSFIIKHQIKFYLKRILIFA